MKQLARGSIELDDFPQVRDLLPATNSEGNSHGAVKPYSERLQWQSQRPAQLKERIEPKLS